MMIMIVNVVFWSVAFRVLGGGFIDAPRRYVIPVLGLCLYAALPLSLPLYAAFLYLFFVVRLLPTNDLLSGLHGYSPRRKNGRWQFLSTISRCIWYRSPENWNTWNHYAIIYGFVRASLAIPAMIYIGGWSWIFLLQGVLYYLAGKTRWNASGVIPEVVAGGIYGFIITI